MPRNRRVAGVTALAERDSSELRARNYPAYREDFAAWLQAQAELLRERRFDELDVEHLVEEVEGVGKSEFQALTSALRLILLHMMKWDYQPELRSRSWRTTIHTQRKAVAKRLIQNPSYRSRVAEAVADAYDDVPAEVEKETTIPAERLPQACPYSWDEIMTRLHDFDPDRPWPN
jgi:hypothetical protein